MFQLWIRTIPTRFWWIRMWSHREVCCTTSSEFPFILRLLSFDLREGFFCHDFVLTFQSSSEPTERNRRSQWQETEGLGRARKVSCGKHFANRVISEFLEEREPTVGVEDKSTPRVKENKSFMFVRTRCRIQDPDAVKPDDWWVKIVNPRPSPPPPLPSQLVGRRRRERIYQFSSARSGSADRMRGYCM